MTVGRTDLHIRSFAHLLRWLVILIGLTWILSLSQAALTTRPFDRFNDITGLLLKGDSVGQTFVARYPGLSGIELLVGTFGRGNSPDKATLVLHLRREPGPGPDIATATLPASLLIGENPLYNFSFPPVAESQDQRFYFEVESPDSTPENTLTLYWWNVKDEGDPYANGTAYINSLPQRGDVSFTLHYAASPIQVWTRTAKEIGNRAPGPAIFAVLVLSGALALSVIFLAWRYRGGLRRWLLRRSLVVVLSLAMLNGIMYMLLVPPWQGPDEHAHFTYAVLLDKHDLNAALVKKLYHDRYVRDQPLAEAVNSSMDAHDFTRLLRGDDAPGAKVDAEGTSLWELTQPPTYYWFCALAMRAARLIGFTVDPYADPDGVLMLMRGVSVLMSMGIAALAWLAGKLLGSKKHVWLRVLLPLTLTLFPMHAFIDSVVNNDVLAELTVSALFVALVSLLKAPAGSGGLYRAALVVLLAGASAYTKSSALTAVVPLAGAGLLIWFGMRLRAAQRRPGEESGARPWSGVRKAALVVGAIVAVVVLFGVVRLVADAQGGTVGWRVAKDPTQYVPRVASDSAHSGSYVMSLAAAPDGSAFSQMLIPRISHPAITIMFGGWARLVKSAESTSAVVISQITTGASELGKKEVPLDATGAWTPFTSEAAIPESADAVTLVVAAYGNNKTVQFDDLSAEIKGLPVIWENSAFKPGLLNGSAELGALSLPPLIAQALPPIPVYMADALLNPQTFNRKLLARDYANTDYRSFWGEFGWLSVPLPESLYFMLGVLTLAAILGLVSAVVRRGTPGYLMLLGMLTFASFCFAVLVGFLVEMAAVSAYGDVAYLQGRYLFVLAAPAVWLILAGLWHLLRTIQAGLGRLSGKRATSLSNFQPRWDRVRTMPRLLPWEVWTWLFMLLLFASYCLFVLIIPYYYG